jgi:hypothetical protein
MQAQMARYPCATVTLLHQQGQKYRDRSAGERNFMFPFMWQPASGSISALARRQVKLRVVKVRMDRYPDVSRELGSKFFTNQSLLKTD